MNSIINYLLFLAIILFGCSGSDTLPTDTPGLDSLGYTLGISFPPVADSGQRNFTQPLLKDLNVNYIRIGENWAFREPEKGNFNWAPLDARISWAERNGIKVLLTIQSNGPYWACSSQQNKNSCVYSDNKAFKNYIEQLLQRYPNKISKIQFGNEWQSDFWYAGNEQQFVAANNIVFTAVQEYSPLTTFVLGGFTTISLRFLAGCNGLIDTFYDDEGILYDRVFLEENCNRIEYISVKDRIDHVISNALYDLVDIHLYDDVENWNIYVTHIRSMIDKPIIVSEFGGPNINIEPDNEHYQSERLAAYLKALNSLEIEEAYFFKLVEGSNNPAHAKSGLIDGLSLKKKMSYFTVKEMNR